jgi:predicted 2-oxoglutarate/Fe(II)-dependent dioxygenase YbiX
VRLSTRRHGSNAGWVPTHGPSPRASGGSGKQRGGARLLARASGPSQVEKALDSVLFKPGGLDFVTIHRRAKWLAEMLELDAEAKGTGKGKITSSPQIEPTGQGKKRKGEKGSPRREAAPLGDGATGLDADDATEERVAAAERAEAAGNRAREKGGAAGLKQAVGHYRECVRILSGLAPGDYEAVLAARVCGSLADCHLQRKEWWPAMLAAESAIGGTAGRISAFDPSVLFATHQRARAAAALGLLTKAHKDYTNVQRCASGPHAQQVAAEREAVEARIAAVQSGSGLASECELLGSSLLDKEGLGDRALVGEREVMRVQRVIEMLCRGPSGRAALHRDGMLDDDREIAGGAEGLKRAVHRALHRHLLYSANIMMHDVEVVRARAGEGLISPINYCSSPERIFRTSAPSLLSPSDLQTLRRERLVVVDGALPAELVARASAEIAEMARVGAVAADHDDLCAPNTKRNNLLLHEGVLPGADATTKPGLSECVEAVTSLPHLLSEALGLSLRVPQTVMVTAMPPGAAYREHVDSIHGRDNPRIITVLLYLSYDPPNGGALRVHLPGGSRDVYPLPGRLCVFFSQEIVHAVLPSEGERHALTLWIWDTKPDGAGR